MRGQLCASASFARTGKTETQAEMQRRNGKRKIARANGIRSYDGGDYGRILFAPTMGGITGGMVFAPTSPRQLDVPKVRGTIK